MAFAARVAAARYAGRFAVGTHQQVVLSKVGATQTTVQSSSADADTPPEIEMQAGLACSQPLSGHRMGAVLTPGLTLQSEAVAALRAGQSANILSIHTSGGVSPALEPFAEALSSRLPFCAADNPDWFFNLQIEGASAVHAGVDGLLQLQRVRGHAGRTCVAVSASSYHGPPSTSFGSRAPFGPKPSQRVYPAPTVLAKAEGEDETRFHARLKTEFTAWLDVHADEVGVLLVEPQWGSSVVGQPWPTELLRWYCEAAQARGILVLADEIMCGLHRHGRGGLFASATLGIAPDAYTLGKGLGGGVYPMSMALFRGGGAELEAAGCGIVQSHTFAGSSTLALVTATAVLDELSDLDPHIQSSARLVETELNQPITTDGRGVVWAAHGQGLLWGVLLRPSSRVDTLAVFREECGQVKVRPYFVNVAGTGGGFIISPPLDIGESELRELCQRLAQAVKATAVRCEDTHRT